jgi:hypothetical protein
MNVCRTRRTAYLLVTLYGTVVTCAPLLGCANVEVGVNAYLAMQRVFPDPSAESCIAIVATTEPPEPLLDVEIASKIEHLLVERGYTTTAEQEARYVLFCFAAIDAGQTHKGVTPVHEPGKTIDTHYYSRGGRYAVKRTYIPGQTRYIPYEYTLYTRSLALELCDRRQLEDAEEREKHRAVVWRCTAVSSGPESDLRWIVNHLLLVAFDYFGQDTGKQQRRTVAYEDRRVEELARVVSSGGADPSLPR